MLAVLLRRQLGSPHQPAEQHIRGYLPYRKETVCLREVTKTFKSLPPKSLWCTVIGAYIACTDKKLMTHRSPREYPSLAVQGFPLEL